MLFKEIIRKKRDGGALSKTEIDFFVSGLADESIPVEQVAALAMAILLKSMTPEETGLLTAAMARSGAVLDWEAEHLPGPVIDKHSTGGVGDKVSFLLAPMAAACGCFVPMISGRGLGHTGGTLDKAGAIPGYDPFPEIDALKKIIRSVGCAIIGQTSDLAPADRRLYAIRDVTGTVESVPLITASILSKKVAAGNASLVMDIKVGSGAFMQTVKEARALAASIIRTADTIGLKTHALLTGMSEVLGTTAGNAVEVKECVDYLTGGKREARLHEVVMALTGEMLVMTDLAADLSVARTKLETALASGKAAEVFSKMVSALGGPADFLEKADSYLPTAPVIAPAYPQHGGYLSAVDGRAIGNSIIDLGGGRNQADAELDLSVGYTDVAPIGAQVGPDIPLAIIHAASADDFNRAQEQLRNASSISDAPPANRPAILETLHMGNLG